MPKEDKPKDDTTIDAKPSKPKPKDDTTIDAKPSKPIDKNEKDKQKDKNKDKTKKLKHMESVEINAEGSITAGNWVAEFDKANVRRNKLRVG